MAAAAQGAALRILAVNGKKELHETVWNPPTASSDARFDPRFRKVGTWNPANGPLHSLAASTVQDPPPAGTARVVLDSLPVLRQTAGAAPDPRVTRLQQLLNLAGLGATATTGSGQLAETGVYDAPRPTPSAASRRPRASPRPASWTLAPGGRS
ncbi:MAG TPA: hypothetical protein VJ966_07460 [Actinomycetes bacterium]|nr:hypothetical protein [Actinomycetes bacterium]